MCVLWIYGFTPKKCPYNIKLTQKFLVLWMQKIAKRNEYAVVSNKAFTLAEINF